MNKSSLAALLALCFFTAPSADAAVRGGTKTVGFFAGAYQFDSDLDQDTNAEIGARLGYGLTDALGLEGALGYAPGSDVDLSHLHLDALYHFQPQERLVPYLAAGVGVLRNGGDYGADFDRGTVNAGGGIKYAINEAVTLRGDVRAYLYSVGERLFNYEYTVGVDFPLGGRPAAPAVAKPAPVVVAAAPVAAPVAPVAPAPPTDSDKDGVFDASDQCPGTPAGVKVDAAGCPLDSDKDGVIDAEDQCPGTPAGIKVDAKGCPLDSDKDGVIDADDQCPGTRAGLAVDRKGCPPPVEENVKIAIDVLFATGKADINEKYTADIKRLAEFMRTYPGTTTVIEGHTDSVGSALANKALSQRRAEAVRRYLIEREGIAAERIGAVGYGLERPIADNATAEGRQKNRRIEAAIETQVVKPQ